MANLLLIDCIKKLEETFVSQHHSLLGSPTISIVKIEGGKADNIVPDKCTITIDRRLIPQENFGDAMEEVNRLIEKVKKDVPELKIEIESPFVLAQPLETSINSYVVKVLENVLSNISVPNYKIEGVEYSSDACRLAASGMPSVLIGPGDINVVHSSKEYIEVAEVITAAEIFKNLMINYGGDNI